MTQEEYYLALAAAVIGSPVLVKAVEALIDWRKGRLSKIAALEAALDEAQEIIDDLERRKRNLRTAHHAELDEMNEKIRQLTEEVHRLRLSLMSLGKDPDADFIT